MSAEAPSAPDWRTFGLCAAVVFMVSLDATVVVAAYPALRRYFSDASPAALSWTLNGFSIVYAALLIAAGQLADRFGRKRFFLVGLAVFTGASAACAVAESAAWLVVARVVQGLGGALLTPASLALILAGFPVAKRQQAVGLWSAVGALAAAFGPVAGSALIEGASWRWIFLINLPVGLVAWGWAYLRLRESADHAPGVAFDLVGTLLLMLGVGALAYGLARTGEVGWGSREVLGAGWLGGGALLVLGWRARSTRPDRLRFPGFGNAPARWASAATVVFGAVFSAGFLSFYLFMTGVWRYPQGLAGWAATPGPLVVVVVAILTSNLATRVGRRTLLLVGGALYAGGNAWFSATIRGEPDFLGTWLPGQLVTGVGIGLLLPALTGVAVAGLAPAQFATGNAVNSALRLLGGALGVALTAAWVGRVGTGYEQFRQLYAWLAGGGVLVTLLCVPLPRLARAAVPQPGLLPQEP